METTQMKTQSPDDKQHDEAKGYGNGAVTLQERLRSPMEIPDIGEVRAIRDEAANRIDQLERELAEAQTIIASGRTIIKAKDVVNDKLLSDNERLRAKAQQSTPSAKAFTVEEARRAWHRHLGRDTNEPCPTERECRAFDAGFLARPEAESKYADGYAAGLSKAADIARYWDRDEGLFALSEKLAAEASQHRGPSRT